MNPKTLVLSPVGEFVQREDSEEFYDSKSSVAVPFLNNQEMRFSLLFEPSDTEFINEAEKILQQFFQLTPQDRYKISEYVWQDCRQFLEAIEYDEADEALHQIQKADEIWHFVQPDSIEITRDTQSDKLFLLLYCDWEMEHGLQLSIRENMILTAVTPILIYPKDDGLEIKLLES